MIFGMIKLFTVIVFVYLLIQMIKKHNPNSPLLDLFEFLLGFLEGFLVICGLALLMVFAIGLLILL